jgi:hypothetical protein
MNEKAVKKSVFEKSSRRLHGTAVAPPFCS